MPPPNWRNRTLFHGDNLPVLRGMNSASVHLIATDPPFNKSRDFHATPDSLAAGARFEDRWSWERDVHQSWVDEIKDDWPGVHAVIEAAKAAKMPDMAAFLCWLGVRLIEMRRILRDDGSLYLHIDSTAHAWVKAMLDGIFGRKNFRNEIVWKRSHAHSSAKRYGPIHDLLLYYTKTDKYTWADSRHGYDQEYIDRYFKFDDGDGRGRYWTGDLTGAGIRKGETGKLWRGFSPTEKGRHWMYPPKRLDALDADGRIYWPKTAKARPKLKRYLNEAKGLPLQDIIDDIYALQTMGSSQTERTGYPTQKPLALYERIIKASSNPGDMVLDPFCGCATTPIAAERLERQWAGIDIWAEAHAVVLQRIEDNRQLLREPDPKVYLEEEPPIRTDEGEVSAPTLTLKLQRPIEPWQRLTHAEMRGHLEQAQDWGGFGITCAGCGRILEKEFMQLDHLTPRAMGGENYITNRVLICQPCNLRKSDALTLSGLWKDNRKIRWMKDAGQARWAFDQAKKCSEGLADQKLLP